MAVFKATYTRSRGGAKASVGYIQQRPGKDKEPITRTLFSRDGALGRLEAESFIDGAGEGSFFYRFVISPDPSNEDTGRDLNMQGLTYKTMQALDRRFHTTLVWVAALHDDHAEHRHVHAIAVVPRRLYVKDLAQLRHAATRECVAQRRILDFGQEAKDRQRYPMYQTVKYARTNRVSRSIARGGSSSQMHACTCPRCGAMHVAYGRQSAHQCTCGLLLHRKKEQALQRKGVGRER